MATLLNDTDCTESVTEKTIELLKDGHNSDPFLDDWKWIPETDITKQLKNKIWKDSLTGDDTCIPLAASITTEQAFGNHPILAFDLLYTEQQQGSSVWAQRDIHLKIPIPSETVQGFRAKLDLAAREEVDSWWEKYPRPHMRKYHFDVTDTKDSMLECISTLLDKQLLIILTRLGQIALKDREDEALVFEIPQGHHTTAKAVYYRTEGPVRIVRKWGENHWKPGGIMGNYWWTGDINSKIAGCPKPHSHAHCSLTIEDIIPEDERLADKQNSGKN